MREVRRSEVFGLLERWNSTKTGYVAEVVEILLRDPIESPSSPVKMSGGICCFSTS